MQAHTGYGFEPALFTVWKDSTLVTSIIGAVPISGVTIMDRTSFEVEVVAEDTLLHTYQVRVGSPNSRGVMVNYSWATTMGGTISSIFVVDEILL